MKSFLGANDGSTEGLMTLPAQVYPFSFSDQVEGYIMCIIPILSVIAMSVRAAGLPRHAGSMSELLHPPNLI